MNAPGASIRPARLTIAAEALLLGMLLAMSAPTAQAKRPHCDGKRATIVGTQERDRIQGSAGRDVIAALGGSDRVKRLDGEDRVCAGAGGDRVAAKITTAPEDSPARGATPAAAPQRADREGRPQFANLGGGADRLVVHCSGSDPPSGPLIRGGAGDDELEIRCAANDVILAGPGDDVVYAGRGRDEVHGDEGNDLLVDEFSRVEDCDQGLPLLYPQYGPDNRCVQITRQIFLSYEDSWLGGEGEDVIRGGEANDWVAGDEGNDRLFGGPGADSIVGGDGTDYCDGGDSDDAFDGSGECETALGFETWKPGPPLFPDCSSAADPAGYAACLSTRAHLARISWSPSTLNLGSSHGEAWLILGIRDPFPREPHIAVNRYKAELTSSIGDTRTLEMSCGNGVDGPTEYDCPPARLGVGGYTASWRMTGLTITYGGGVESFYTERDLEEQLGGPSPELQVNGKSDDNPPRASRLSVEPPTVDVSASDAWVTFTYFASDWETRIGGGDVRVSHNGDKVPSPPSSTVIADDWRETQFSETVMIPRGSPAGDYDITVRIVDGHGNETIYGPGYPEQLDPPTFEVTNAPWRPSGDRPRSAQQG